ncbi:hypothetical protein [Paenibacillus sambharensis]|uniref:hypothetical protein n=1 Tax=Paenibacillus sambharensis TaxID=1803190 RepID=UPI0015E8D0DF|nr:hypothetical protein [Paenibacillus sambharensis]
MEHKSSLWQAWRWYSEEQLEIWLQVSIYAPEQPDDYEPVTAILTIDTEVANERESEAVPED